MSFDNWPDFEKTFQHTLRFEGGYVHDPHDRGGETFRGVSRQSWPHWPGWERIDQAKQRGLTTAKLINGFFENDLEMAELVRNFYYQNFWEPFQPLMASWRVHSKIFDTAVNVGIGQAVKMIQRSLNQMGLEPPLVVDGSLGPKTEASFIRILADGSFEDHFLNNVVLLQENHYRYLAEKNPSQEKFIRGWLRRAWWLPV